MAVPLLPNPRLSVRLTFDTFHCFRRGEGGNTATFTTKVENRL